MANIKATANNIDQIITDMENNTGSARSDSFYFVSNELSPNTIRQMAWDQNIVLTISSINDYNSKFVFFEILN
jgi:hypothetical protein